MGQAYCVKLCGENDTLAEDPLKHLLNYEADEPIPEFAKRVKQHIEIHSKVKETYMLYRSFLITQAPRIPLKKRELNSSSTTFFNTQRTIKESGRVAFLMDLDVLYTTTVRFMKAVSITELLSVTKPFSYEKTAVFSEATFARTRPAVMESFQQINSFIKVIGWMTYQMERQNKYTVVFHSMRVSLSTA